MDNNDEREGSITRLYGKKDVSPARFPQYCHKLLLTI